MTDVDYLKQQVNKEAPTSTRKNNKLVDLGDLFS